MYRGERAPPRLTALTLPEVTAGPHSSVRPVLAVHFVGGGG